MKNKFVITPVIFNFNEFQHITSRKAQRWLKSLNQITAAKSALAPTPVKVTQSKLSDLLANAAASSVLSIFPAVVSVVVWPVTSLRASISACVIVFVDQVVRLRWLYRPEYGRSSRSPRHCFAVAQPRWRIEELKAEFVLRECYYRVSGKILIYISLRRDSFARKMINA